MSLATVISLATLLVGIFGGYFVARFVSKSNLPSVANDTIEVFEARIRQLEAAAARDLTEKTQLRASLADLQIKYSTLLDVVVKGSSHCADCPVLNNFRDPING